MILSAHLDDAALSCWHLLTQPDDVMVINAFAGVPAGLRAPALAAAVWARVLATTVRP